MNPLRMARPTSALIIDDEAHVRVYLRMLLQSVGVTTVWEAVDGKEAVALFALHRPEVVLLDLAMPGMNGPELARRMSHTLKGVAGNLSATGVQAAALARDTAAGRKPLLRRSMRSRSFWISAPKIVPLPRMILKPLSSSGLWLAVIITPPSASRWNTEK